MSNTTSAAAVAAAAASADGVQPCRLLDLPAELKNEIYRLVVVTSDKEHPIEVTARGFERSALFLTCKEVREDAIEIYLLENWFHHEIMAFKSTTLAIFQEICLKYLTRQQLLQMQLKVPVVFASNAEGGTCSMWENLKVYLYDFHSLRVMIRPPSPAELCEIVPDLDSDKMLFHIIGGMFMILEASFKEPWEKLAPIFDGFRPSLIAFNKKWAK